jgi:hypothetical protein
LFLGDDDEDSYGPDPEQGEIMGLLMLLGLTRLNFQRAALSITSNLLGGFEVYGGSELFCASVRVNARKKELRSYFVYGGERAIDELDVLEDPVEEDEEDDEA